MPRLLTLVILLVHFGTYCQVVQNSRALNHYSDNLWIVNERVADKHAIFNSDTVVYYGIDFSHIKIIVADLAADSSECIVDFDYWSSRLNKRIIGDSNKIRLSRLLKKTVLLNNDTMNRLTAPAPNAIFDTVPPDYNILEIWDIIAAYPFSGNQKIGFSVIMESLDHTLNKVTANFIFFNPSTDQILWCIKMQTPVKNVETRRKWSDGMESLYFRFRKIYFQRRKEF